jgi:hypothetical protein
LLFCRAIMRSLIRVPWEWRPRSHRLGFRGALYKTAETHFSSYLEPILRILKLPQFHMGADPIIMSELGGKDATVPIMEENNNANSSKHK